MIDRSPQNVSSSCKPWRRVGLATWHLTLSCNKCVWHCGQVDAAKTSALEELGTVNKQSHGGRTHPNTYQSPTT